MAVITEDILSHHVVFYTGPQGNNGPDAKISIIIQSGWADLNFYPEGIAMPSNVKTQRPNSPNKFQFNVSFKYSQLSSILDSLRNGKGKFYYNDAGNKSYVSLD